MTYPINQNINMVAWMCHAPIVIPKIGKKRASECAKTTEAMRKVASKIFHSESDSILILSPHTPRIEDRFGWVSNSNIHADFSVFGNNEINIEFENDKEFITEMSRHHQRLHGLFQPIVVPFLDHGVGVPLYFLKEAGWNKPVAVLSLSMNMNDKSPFHLHKKVSHELKYIFSQLHKKWTILASGDMSHRLIPEAPAGFHPRAKEFDQWVVEALREGNCEKACSVSDEMRDWAGEDIVDVLEISSRAVNRNNLNHHLYSYEGPFGVGYSVGILYEQ